VKKYNVLEIATFDEWMQLKETGTSTGDVAGFQRIAIPLVRRIFPSEITFDTKDKKKKQKPYMQPQVKE